MFQGIRAYGDSPAAGFGKVIRLERRLQFHLALLTAVLLLCIFPLLFFLGILQLPAQSISDSLKGSLREYNFRMSSYFSKLAAHGICLSEALSAEIENTLLASGAGFEAVSNNPELIERLQEKSYQILHDTLLIADGSGAFVIFDATLNTAAPDAEYIRSGVWLRYSDPGRPVSLNPDLRWLRGIAYSEKAQDILFHSHWKLEFSLRNLPFYNRLKEHASSQLTECFFYSPRLRLHKSDETMLLLCVPILGQDGCFYGICGIEISPIHFKLTHTLDSSNIQQLSGLIARQKNEWLLPATGLESGSASGYFAGLDKPLYREKNIYGSLYRYTSSSRSFVGFDYPIQLSPLFPDNVWRIACLLPEEEFDQVIWSYIIRAVIACTVLALAAILTSRQIGRRCLAPLLCRIDSVKSGLVEQTNILEIDDLISSFKQRNTAEAAPPQADMPDLHTFKENIQKLSPAEQAVFALYLENCPPQRIAEMLHISINTVKSHNKRIYAKFGVSSRKELMVYIRMLNLCSEDLTKNASESKTAS